MVIIRPLMPEDRSELARAYDELSENSRRRRFFSPPKHLSEPLLDYLTNLDYDDRFALVAHPVGEPNHGLGVARWVRSRRDRSLADAAVTVIDDWQGRGLGTHLLMALIDEALDHEISVFTADVLWENKVVLDPLRDLGARIRPSEPGVATVEFDLPSRSAELIGTAIDQFFVSVASDEPPGRSTRHSVGNVEAPPAT